MKRTLAIVSLLTALGVSLAQAAPESPVLSHRLAVAPAIKKTFFGDDHIQIRSISGTAAQFEIGGTYRVIGTCRQQAIKRASLYLGNTTETAGAEAIVAHAGSPLSKASPNGTTEFDITFTVLRPGVIHVTIYDLDRAGENDQAYAGLYLGNVR